MSQPPELPGPDLATDGIPIVSLAAGEMVAGHANGKRVVLIRTADGFRALEGKCTHYGALLAGGIFDGAQVRCPSHHACFDVKTGRPTRAPALDPLGAFEVATRGGRAFVAGPVAQPPVPEPRHSPGSVVIVGAGAAGGAAAETLRLEGFRGPITLIDAEPVGPVDRPNLSKDYLAGTAPEEWVPLRPAGFYEEKGIDLLTGRSVAAIDAEAHSVLLDGGKGLRYGALLLATGAAPVRLTMPGGDLPHVHYLRSLADSRAIVAGLEGSRAAVVVGASFIGLEVAASLRARGLEVHVVAPELVLMERVLGVRGGGLIRSIHEAEGVAFHLGRTVGGIGEKQVTLDDGTELAADLVVIGVGVRPRVELAQAAGLAVDKGVVVDRFLATSAPDIWAAGDIARWPHPRFGPIRVEHWVVAERQGQIAARNMLGAGVPFDDIPFFWSRHYDLRINYVGHAQGFDEVRFTEGEDGSFLASYLTDGRVQAVASLRRDRDSLRAEIALEGGDEEALARLAGAAS